jgi:hypothetical protein
MCGLCGIFGSDDHWATERGTGPSADPRKRRMDRAARVRAVNDLLGSRGISISDWNADAFLVSSATGMTVVVDTLSDVWEAIETQFGRIYDPLREG